MLKPLNNLGHAGAATTYTRLDSPFVRRANLIFVCERAKQLEAARLLNKTLQPGEFQLIWLDALVPEMARRLREAGISENVSSHALRREMKQFQQTFDFDTNEALLVTKSAIENFATEREPKPTFYARAYGLLARVFQQLTTNHGIALLVNQSTDPEGIINQGHNNLTARSIQIRQGEHINERALLNLFKAVIANNRAGGWRKLKPS